MKGLEIKRDKDGLMDTSVRASSPSSSQSKARATPLDEVSFKLEMPVH